MEQSPKKCKKSYNFLSNEENLLITKKQSDMSDDEIDKFYKIKQKILNKQKNDILLKRAIKENKKDPARKKINRAKFILAGELLKRDGKSFLEDLAKNASFSQQDADALALLAKEYGLDIAFPVNQGNQL